MSRLILLSKPGCHLCQVMREVVEPVAAERGFVLVEIDVRQDPETQRLYGTEIPVLLQDGREIARHHITAGELRSRLGDPDRS